MVMKKILYTALAAVMMLTAAQANAQVGKRYYINSGWQFNATPGNSFVESAQAWGAYIEGGYYVSPKLAVGGFAKFSNNDKYYPQETYKLDEDSALTTDHSRVLYQLPFGATVRYRFLRNKVQPYVEAKIGANYAEANTYFASMLAADDSWGFYASPEIGLTVHPFNSTNFGFQLAVYYAYATNQNKFHNMNGINNLGFKLGLSF